MSEDGFLAKKLAEGAGAFRLYGLGPSGASRNLLERYSSSLGLSEICDQLEAKAKVYANTVGGNQAFQVVAVDENEKEIGCDVFRLQAESPLGPAGLMTEPANEGGLVQQNMRHTEALVRSLLQQQAQTDKVQSRIVDRVLQRNEQLEARVVGAIELMGKLARDDNAQAIEMYKAKISAESKHEITKKLAAVIPIAMDAIGAKYGGKAISGATLTNSVKAVFDTLQPEQVQQLLSILNEQQRLQIMAVFKRLASTEEADKPKTEAPDVGEQSNGGG